MNIKTIIAISFSLFLNSCNNEKFMEAIFHEDDCDISIHDLHEQVNHMLVKDTNISIMSSEVTPLDFNTHEIEKHEGCTDYMVWPGAYSGPTIACGLDLANIGDANVEKILNGRVSNHVYNILIEATNHRGPEAEEWIKHHQVHIGQHNAILLCNGLKTLVWQKALQSYPNLEKAPASVKEAVMNACVASGVGSTRLTWMGNEIANSDWIGVADAIANSHSDMIGGPYERIWKSEQMMAMKIRLSFTKYNKSQVDYD